MSVSSPRRIISVSDYKTIMRIGDTGQDTILATVLPIAMRGVEQYCGRKFCEYETDGLSIYFDGAAATAATVTVTETVLTLSSTTAAVTTTTALTLADAANDTLTELEAVIEAVSGWHVTLVAAGTSASTDLMPVASQSVLTSALTKTLGIRADITEYFDGTGHEHFIRPEYLPIISVTTLSDDVDREFTGTSYDIDTDDYVVYEDKVKLDGTHFNEGKKNIRLVYRGGYTPAQLEGDECADLRLGAALFMSFMKERVPIANVRSELNLETGVEQRFILGMPGFVRQLLDPYRYKGF